MMKTQSALTGLRRLVVGLSLTVGLGSMWVSGSTVQAEVAVPVQPQVVPTNLRSTAPAQVSLPDGVYLYGQSAQPDQTGVPYFVFEARQGKVLGAFYMPRSSFDCAYGAVQPEKVALTVIDSYEKTAHPYDIAVERGASIASQGNPAVTQLGLEGFQRIQPVSSNDQRILQVCRTNYPQVLK
jgi:hypothetical protein